MSTYRFDRLFAPKSVAVVGASAREGSLGRAVLQNLRERGFAGQIDLVNPRQTQINGSPCAPNLGSLPQPPDVAVIVSPAASVPAIIGEAGRLGVGAAIVITAGLGYGPGSLNEQVAKSARATGLRIVGPNCLGFVSPGASFDASFTARRAKRGNIALVSQSGAVVAALLEWAHARDIGFSGIVSLGDQIDVDFGDCLNYFAEDAETKAIFLYIEAISDARKFMSAGRAAARVKPVIAIKSGRHGAGIKAALSHTGALAGSDAVYEAALHRAGILRVLGLEELFSAAETLARVAPFEGDRLTVVTNGGGVGVLAVDRLADMGGKLAKLSAATIDTISGSIPAGWSRGNPIDIIGDADAARYGAAMRAALRDPETEAILAINCPTALTKQEETAQAVIEAVASRRTEVIWPPPVFAVWFGATPEVASRFETSGIPHFESETEAVRGFMHLVNHVRAQAALLQTPPSVPVDFTPDAGAARRIVAAALAKGAGWLDPIEVAAVLNSYDVPIAPVFAAANPADASQAARAPIAAGSKVALKIMSQQIAHKSDVGGVALNLDNAQAVADAAQKMLDTVSRLKPEARIDGFVVQPMIHRPGAHELIAGLASDPTFGPVIVFGHGGMAVEVIDDKALALPPLDLRLAHDLIGRTRIAAVLKGYRDVPRADIDAIALTLMKLAQLSADIPEIIELDLNPLLADANGVVALDARIRIEMQARPARRESTNPRFAIKPYPREWERELNTRGGAAVLARPIRPEDEKLYADFFAHVSPRDLRLRFFSAMKNFGHGFIARLAQIDYSRSMAFVALDRANQTLLGVVRLHFDANHENGEFAILVRSDRKGRGLGWSLMQLIIEYARAEGAKTICGQVMAENTEMLAMCAELGFAVADQFDTTELKSVSLQL